MGKKEKLLDNAKNSANNFRFSDLLKLAESHGFVFKRKKGSHIMMKPTDKSLLMNFQDVNGEAKPYQVKRLLDTIDEYKL